MERKIYETIASLLLAIENCKKSGLEINIFTVVADTQIVLLLLLLKRLLLIRKITKLQLKILNTL